MIMATMPVRKTLMIRELIMENQWTVSLQQGHHGDATNHGECTGGTATTNEMSALAK